MKTMGLGTIALAHLRRHKGRTALMLVGLATAVAAFVAVMSLVVGIRNTLDDRLARYGASMVVTPANPELSLNYGGIALETAGSAAAPIMPSNVVEAIDSIEARESIAAVIPVLLEPVSLAGSDYLAIGTDIAASSGVKPWWQVEGELPTTPREILLGLNARNDLQAEAGTSLVIGGRSYVVSGVLRETGGEEDNAIIMDREELGRLVGRGDELNLVEIAAAESGAVDAIVAQVGQVLPAVTVASVKQTLEFNAQANSFLAEFGLAATFLVVAVAALIVVLTMLTAVRERRGEIGVFRALGFRQRDVATLLFRESLLVGAAAAVVGALLGLAGAAFGPRLVRGLTLDFVPNLPVIFMGMGLSVVLSVVATLYPAYLAARLDPAVALKRL